MRGYNRGMARGWESKSVEEQQSSAKEGKPSGRPATPQEIERRNQRLSLELTRARVAHELESAQNPRYRELLQTELAALDKRLAALR